MSKLIVVNVTDYNLAKRLGERFSKDEDYEVQGSPVYAKRADLIIVDEHRYIDFYGQEGKTLVLCYRPRGVDEAYCGTKPEARAKAVAHSNIPSVSSPLLP